MRLFDRVLVAVAVNTGKPPIFTPDERVRLIKASLAGVKRVEVDSFSGLTSEYSTRKGACTIVRGVRSGTDADFETAMAAINRQLAPSVETVILPARPETAGISSSFVREIASSGGDVGRFVPRAVISALKKKFR